MAEILLLALVLGLSAGLAPGPLLALVIAETLRHDVAAGIRVAIVPLVTDLPLIALTLLLLAQLAELQLVLGAISVVGGVVLLLMGYEVLRSPGIVVDPGPDVSVRPPTSLVRGALANLLSPHPYLFWISVGGPLMLKAMAVAVALPVLFVLIFYACLVGSKILLAVMVGRSKALLSGRALTYGFRLVGVLLCLLALGLFSDGLGLLGSIGQGAIGSDILPAKA
ncbi:LysE family translocator [Thiohalocapsa marina]|uniref:LysE family translocator n=1 Tax=Thiohalocapsa marina TaxID=424902 RepID=A0A5M8FAP0_9GAMM|nr:LysE family transporter [Thiohalocapsa marina]KAA6181893.1 LysE family translocator [Thiohalocapsa marina]